MDWDGERFGMQADTTSITRYEGTKKITELPIYPLKYYSDDIDVQKRRIARSRKWESYCECSFKAYKGKASDGSEADSRISLDTPAYNMISSQGSAQLKKVE